MLSFKQFHFDPNHNFEPSKQAKEAWLYTKKSTANFAGVQLPGLFQSVGYSVQMAAFIGILILEGIPTYLGYDNGVNITGILAAIFIDIMLAILSHWWHDKVCLFENELIVENNPVRKEFLKRQVSKYKLRGYFFYFIILMSAAFKFYIFFEVYATMDTTSIFVLSCYLLGALLHIGYTGYFFYTSVYNYKMQKENDKFIISNGIQFGITGSLEQPIETANVELKETSAGKHKIIKKADNKYYFVTYGVLLDNELAALIGVQPTVAQTIVAREGLKHQLLILNTNIA